MKRQTFGIWNVELFGSLIIHVILKYFTNAHFMTSRFVFICASERRGFNKIHRASPAKGSPSRDHGQIRGRGQNRGRGQRRGQGQSRGRGRKGYPDPLTSEFVEIAQSLGAIKLDPHLLVTQLSFLDLMLVFVSILI